MSSRTLGEYYRSDRRLGLMLLTFFTATALTLTAAMHPIAKADTSILSDVEKVALRKIVRYTLEGINELQDASMNKKRQVMPLSLQYTVDRAAAIMGSFMGGLPTPPKQNLQTQVKQWLKCVSGKKIEVKGSFEGYEDASVKTTADYHAEPRGKVQASNCQFLSPHSWASLSTTMPSPRFALDIDFDGRGFLTASLLSAQKIRNFKSSWIRRILQYEIEVHGKGKVGIHLPPPLNLQVIQSTKVAVDFLVTSENSLNFAMIGLDPLAPEDPKKRSDWLRQQERDFWIQVLRCDGKVNINGREMDCAIPTKAAVETLFPVGNIPYPNL